MMTSNKPALFLLLGAMLVAAAHAEQPVRQHAVHPPDHLHLSPVLTQLLQQEMKAIQEGMQALVTAIASGNWQDVADIGASIRDSYIMQQQLTAEQREELRYSLPDAFMELDRSFHRAAGRLEQAASSHNADMAGFYFYKLMDACVACHSRYAGHRFPGLSDHNAGEEHHH
jgi:hypothetical protein